MHQQLPIRWNTLGQKSMAWLLVLGLISLLAGCLADADRGNPLDSLSDNFEDAGEVTGLVTRLYPPFTGMAGVELRLEPGPHVVLSGTNGQFTFRGIPTGIYRLRAESPGYVADLDSLITVNLGQVAEVDVRLNGLPEFDRVQLQTVHVSRWWPQNDLYQLEIEARVSDPDGLADVRRVWVEMPALNFADTLRLTEESGRYVTLIPENELPTGSLPWMLGRPLIARIQDQAGAEMQDEQTPARIIETTPTTVSPQELAQVESRQPKLIWNPASLRYAFGYRVDIVRVETNLQTTAQIIEDIPSDSSWVQVPASLDPGSYFWTISIVDEFGNRSRSKEAGFVVN